MVDPVTCHGFAPNPAIFGIGVRISVYVIFILAAITPIKVTLSPRHIREIEQGRKDVQLTWEISSVVTVQGVNGIGLLITALIQIVAGNRLSLYHAFLIINLLLLLNTSFLYFLFSPNPVARRRIFYLLSLVLLAVFSLYVGLTARTFGSQPECNHTIKIMWFPRQTVASFTWFRWFGITIFVIEMTMALLHGAQLLFFRNRSTSESSGKVFRAHGILVLVINLVLAGFLERTIIINNVPENSITSFGQTLPLVMLIVPIMDIYTDNYPWVQAWLLKRRAAKSPGHTPLAYYASHSSHRSRPSHSGYASIDS